MRQKHCVKQVRSRTVLMVKKWWWWL